MLLAGAGEDERSRAVLGEEPAHHTSGARPGLHRLRAGAGGARLGRDRGDPPRAQRGRHRRVPPRRRGEDRLTYLWHPWRRIAAWLRRIATGATGASGARSRAWKLHREAAVARTSAGSFCTRMSRTTPIHDSATSA